MHDFLSGAPSYTLPLVCCTAPSRNKTSITIPGNLKLSFAPTLPIPKETRNYGSGPRSSVAAATVGQDPARSAWLARLNVSTNILPSEPVKAAKPGLASWAWLGQESYQSVYQSVPGSLGRLAGQAEPGSITYSFVMTLQIFASISNHFCPSEPILDTTKVIPSPQFLSADWAIPR